MKKKEIIEEINKNHLEFKGWKREITSLINGDERLSEIWNSLDDEEKYVIMVIKDKIIKG